MQDVPNIVIKHLRDTRVMESHPDPDLLTAFAERALAGQERASVTEHLTQCRDCRDVVALSLPATEGVLVTKSTHTAVASWFSWPVLRWGVVAAAGVLAVVSVGVVQYKRGQTETNTMLSARNEAPASVTQDSSYSSAESAPRAVLPRAEEQKQQKKLQEKTHRGAGNALAADRASGLPKAISPGSREMHDAVSQGEIGGGIGSRSGAGASSGSTTHVGQPATPSEASSPRAGRQVSPPGSSQAVEVQAEAVPANAVQNQVSDLLIQNQKQQSSQNQPFIQSEVVKAKPAAPPQTASGTAPVVVSPNVPLQKSPSLMQRASPRWTISSAGKLERSFDGGNTWEDVNVSAVVSRSKTTNLTADSHGKSEKKDALKPSSSPVFRAVAAIGPQVWAGGTEAMLFHSADSGLHWTQVTPSLNGLILSGDIKVIELSDPQHGKISTSAGEVWLTADGGLTWRGEQ